MIAGATARAARIGSSLLAALVLLAACAPSQTLPRIDDALRGSQVRTVLVGDTATLFSPYASPLSERYLAVAQREYGRVRAEIASGDRPRLRVLLAPASIGNDPALVEEVLPSLDGVGGFVGSAAEVVIVVARDESSIVARDAEACTTVMRHEITHAVVRQLGLDFDQWLDEALATTLESRVVLDDGTLVEDPLPERIVHARFRYRDVPLKCVFDWDPSGVALDDPRERQLALYAKARAFLEFESERDGPRMVRDVVVSLAARSRAELVGDEPAFREWLDGWDWEPRLHDAFRHRCASVRVRASFHLLEIARGLGNDPFGTRFDDEVIARLESQDADFPAAEYLLTVRGANLPSESCERLLRSPSPLARILGLACARLGGRSVDAAILAVAREALTPLEQAIAARALQVLDGEDGGTRTPR